MRRHDTLIALSLVAALSARAAGQDKNAAAQPLPKSVPVENANPLASFARMVSGEWRVTAQSGTSMFHNWTWGPGKHSIRRSTDGAGAGGEPWRELVVYYWHPGRKQVCLLGLSPVARGVSEGTIKFEGEAADAIFDLHQTRGRRRMGQRWAFDGHDKYRDTLLEATGPTGLLPLAEWDHIRSKAPPAARLRAAVVEPKPSKHLKSFEPFLGHTWEAKGDWVAGDAFPIRSTFEYVPYADAIIARVQMPAKNGEPTHLLDAYFYHHTGTNALRCLTLSHRGGVYEGDVTVLDGGGLQLDMKGYEGERAVSLVASFNFERDGSIRQRVWSVKGAERTPMIDVRHQKIETRKG